MNSLFDEGEILDREFSWMIICGILENKINVVDVLHFIPTALKSVMLAHIEGVENNNYIDPNQFINDGLSDLERIKRSEELLPTYKYSFSMIKSYFNEN